METPPACDTGKESTLITIVLDTAATQGTIEVNWKEHLLRTGNRGEGLTERTLLSDNWVREGQTTENAMKIIGNCLYEGSHDNITVVYVDRSEMDERVQADTKNKDGIYDQEIIVDFSLFTRGSQYKQSLADGKGEKRRILHMNEKDISKHTGNTQTSRTEAGQHSYHP